MNPIGKVKHTILVPGRGYAELRKYAPHVHLIQVYATSGQLAVLAYAMQNENVS